MTHPKQIPWESIKKIALLGTDRSNIPEEINLLMASLGTDLDQTEDKIFLDGLTQLSLFYRSARKFPDNTHQLEEQLLPKEQTPPPRAVAEMLGPILDGKFEPVLGEYLRCLAYRQWSFPPDKLPDFLNECLEQPDLWRSVADHIGPTAHWLISMNSSWRRLKSGPQEKDWHSKFLADKLRYFDKLRFQDAEQAIQLLHADWPDFKANAKADFLSVMAEMPTAVDFDFVENLGKEKSKKVQLAAFKIKAQNPKSQLVQEAITLIQDGEIFSFSKKGKGNLKVQLPSTDDAAHLQLIAKHPDFAGGIRANYLAQIIFLLPLQTLIETLKSTPSEVVQIFSQNEWAHALLQGLIHKSILTKNQAWLIALHKCYMDQGTLIPWGETLINRSYTVIDSKSFTALAQHGLGKGQKILDDENAFVELMLGYEKPWPDNVSFAFFKLVKLWLQKNPRYWEGWYIWQIFRKAAFKIDPRQLPVYHKAFTGDPLWGLAEEEIQSMLEILNFRFRLYKIYP